MKNLKIFIAAFAIAFALPSEGFSQSWFDKLEKVITVIDVITDDTSSSTSSSNSNDYSSSSSTDDYSTSYSTSSTGAKITTNHPDFKIDIKRCAVSGKTCVIDLLIENTGSNDVQVTFADIVAYDNEGNEYKNISIMIGDSSNKWIDQIDKTLMSKVPIKARITINGVNESATTIRRINWITYCNAWDLSFNKPVRLQNIPISR